MNINTLVQNAFAAMNVAEKSYSDIRAANWIAYTASSRTGCPADMSAANGAESSAHRAYYAAYKNYVDACIKSA